MMPNPYVINFIYLSVYEKIILVFLSAIFVYFLIEIFVLENSIDYFETVRKLKRKFTGEK